MPSKAVRIVGWIVSVLPCLLLFMSAGMKLTRAPQLTEGFAHLGWNLDHATALGIVELTCTIVFLIPQTAVLGAILLTGYLGGATATHVRIGDPFYTPILLGVALWLGLFLRDPRLRVLIPVRR